MFGSIIDLLYDLLVSYTVIHYWYYAGLAQKPIWPFDLNIINKIKGWFNR